MYVFCAIFCRKRNAVESDRWKKMIILRLLNFNRFCWEKKAAKVNSNVEMCRVIDWRPILFEIGVCLFVFTKLQQKRERSTVSLFIIEMRYTSKILAQVVKYIQNECFIISLVETSRLIICNQISHHWIHQSMMILNDEQLQFLYVLIL